MRLIDADELKEQLKQRYSAAYKWRCETIYKEKADGEIAAFLEAIRTINSAPTIGPGEYAKWREEEKMIAIKGMGMPVCCYSCRFARFSDDFAQIPYCTTVLKAIDLSRFDRPDWCPLVEVEPVKHAEWKEDGALYKCTNCGHTEEYYDMSYCPYCGARMDE